MSLGGGLSAEGQQVSPISQSGDTVTGVLIADQVPGLGDLAPRDPCQELTGIPFRLRSYQ
jgi:hypothetical protein